MIEMRRAQLSFGDGLIAEEISDLRDDWMQYADQVLADEALVTAVYDFGTGDCEQSTDADLDFTNRV